MTDEEVTIEQVMRELVRQSQDLLDTGKEPKDAFMDLVPAEISMLDFLQSSDAAARGLWDAGVRLEILTQMHQDKVIDLIRSTWQQAFLLGWTYCKKRAEQEYGC